MSISQDLEERLSFDMADRMRRALRVSGITVNDMAAHLQVSRNTVTSWINGRNHPRRRDLVAFALRTGFPVEWLETGAEPNDGGDGGGGMVGPAGIEPTTSTVESRRFAQVVSIAPDRLRAAA